MPRRRDALTKIDTALKNLAKQVPGGSELATILTGIVDGKEHYRPAVLDRTCAIAAAGMLEHALEVAIIRHLKPELSERERKELFDSAVGGPLGSFHAKLVMAYALGLLHEDWREDSDTIRVIRNAFAHSVSDIGFTNEEIVKECNALHITDSSRSQLSAKFRFVIMVGVLFRHLMDPSWLDT
jgi:hypothetical protein